MEKTIDVLIHAYSALAYSYARCSTKQAGAVEAYGVVRDTLAAAAKD